MKVEVAGLRAGYGSATILDDVGFGVPDHGAFAVVGRNGMGKIDAAQDGDGLPQALDGGRSRWRGATSRAGRRIASRGSASSYAAQEKSLFGELSVAENLSVGKAEAAVRGRSATR